MFGLILGVFTILLGGKAFTPAGIPLTRKRNLRGKTAKLIGAFCILLGLAFMADGLYSTTLMFSELWKSKS